MSWWRSLIRRLGGAPRRRVRPTVDLRPVAYDAGLVRALEVDHERLERQLLKLLDALRTAEPAVCAWLADSVRAALAGHVARADALYPHVYAAVDPQSGRRFAIETLERDLRALVARFEGFCSRGAACAWSGPPREALALRFEKLVGALRLQFCQEERALYPLYREAAGEPAWPQVPWHHDGVVEVLPLRVRPLRSH